MVEKYKLKNFLKHMIVVLLLIIIAFIMELVIFNYHSFVKKEIVNLSYQDGEEPSEYFQSVEKSNYGIRLTLKKPTYIKKLQLQLNTSESTSYTVFTKYNNSFDKEEVGKKEDVYWPELGTGYTNIDEEVTVLRISFPKDANCNIQSLRLFTETSFNKFRVVFLITVFFMVFIGITKYNWLIKHLEISIAVFSLIMGCYIIFLQGIQQNGWDEAIHFKKVYDLSCGEKIDDNEAYQLMCKRIPLSFYNTLEERKLATQYVNTLYKQNEKEIKNLVGFRYNQTAYLIQAAAVKIGKMINLEFNKMYMLGKFINLLCYAIFIFISLKALPCMKEIAAALFLIPTQLFIASSYTYDVLINGFIFLGICLWIKVVTEQKQRRTIVFVILGLALIGIGSLSKAVYIPIVLLWLCIPSNKYENKRQCYGLWITILTVFILVLLTFVKPTIINLINNTSWGGDIRGGDTDVVSQMRNIFKHPIEYIFMLGREIWKSLGEFIFGQQGITNFGRIKELNAEYSFLVTIWMFLVLFANNCDEYLRIEKRYNFGIVGVISVVAFLIWSAMYLSYTPIGTGRIIGVQARYYAPLLFLFAILCHQSPLNIKIEKKSYTKVLLSFPIIILWISIAEKMIYK